MGEDLSPAAFLQSVALSVKQRDGEMFSNLLDPSRVTVEYQDFSDHELESLAKQYGGEILHDFFLDLLQMRHKTDMQQNLERSCNALKRWVSLYMDQGESSDGWMVKPLTTFCVHVRRLAMQLDEAQPNSNKYLKKMVEIFREHFQKCIKEKSKRQVLVWISCELLRAYFTLGQINQCSFLITALRNVFQQGLRLEYLPRSIAVTFNFFWGKYCVFDHNFREADEKLSWAFDHCHPDSHDNKRRILFYLIPIKMKYGILPTERLLEDYQLPVFVDFVAAMKKGDIRTYSRLLEENADEFIHEGIYLLMERHKLIVYRNLCKRVFALYSGNAGLKLDLPKFEKALQWQEACDEEEASCILSNLIFQGALKGYISHEHKKIVFSKEMPFPPFEMWK